MSEIPKSSVGSRRPVARFHRRSLRDGSGGLAVRRVRGRLFGGRRRLGWAVGICATAQPLACADGRITGLSGVGTSFWQFIRSFGGRWFIAMSGPASVPLAIAGILAPNWPLKVALFGTAGTCFVFAAYWVWRNERLARNELSQQLAKIAARPRLRCSFDTKGGCFWPNTIVTSTKFTNQPDDGGLQQIIERRQCDWYRVKLDADGGSIPGCRARLISIKRDDVPIFASDTPPLQIAHHGQDEPVTVHEGISEYVDFLAIYEDNVVDICVPPNRRTSALDWDNMFSKPGNYRIRVSVVSPNAETDSIDVTLNWTGDKATSDLM
jgi:hypothetical protein